MKSPLLSGHVLCGLMSAALVSCEPAAPLSIAHCGCLSTPDTLGCVVGHKLTLWSPEPVTVSFDGTPTPAEPALTQDGYRYTVSIPPSSQTIEASNADGHWSMAIVPLPAELLEASLEELKAAAENGGPFEGWLNIQIAFEAGEPEQHEAAWPVLEERRDDQLLMLSKSFWVYDRLHSRAQLQQVEAVVQDIIEITPDSANAELQFSRHHLLGLVYRDFGDYRTALRHFRSAHQIAERMGFSVDAAREEIAGVLDLMGQHQEAMDLLREPLRQSDGCNVASRQNDTAWAMLMAADDGFRDSAVPSASADQLIATMKNVIDLLERCGGGDDQFYNSWLNLSLAHLHAGELKHAEAALETAVSFEGRTSRLWELVIAGRLALADGDPDAAVQIFQELIQQADMRRDREGAWLGRQSLAHAYRRAGRISEARTTFEAAQQHALAHSLMVPLQIGRARFLSGQKRAYQEHIAMLLEQQEVTAATDTARQWHSQLFQTLHHAHLSTTASQQSRWMTFLAAYEPIRQEAEALSARWDVLPEEQASVQARIAELEDEAEALIDTHFAQTSRYTTTPRPPSAGELLLLCVELREGWLAAAINQDGTALAPLGPSPTAQQILEPFREQLTTASLITILPSPLTERLDLHATLIGGQPLIAHAPVRYSLDLASLPPRVTDSDPLVVADSRGDLRGARGEGARLREQLPDATVLLGEAATRAAMQAQLAGASLFHFAGHGVLDAAPLSGHLLTASQPFTLADILALPDPPRQVVLTSCETAQTVPEEVLQPGIAHAFLIAGAELAVASARSLPDEIGQTFSEALYDAPLPLNATTVQRAFLKTRQQHPQGDWAALRLLTP